MVRRCADVLLFFPAEFWVAEVTVASGLFVCGRLRSSSFIMPFGDRS